VGGACRTGRGAQQRRQLPADGSISRPRPRFCGAGRTCRHDSTPQQRATATWIRLGDLVEASRAAAQRYPESQFPDAVSELVDAERRAQFEQEGAHFESTYFLTLLWLPPSEEASRTEAWLYEGRSHDGGVDANDLRNGFIDRTNRVLQLFEGFMPEALGSPTSTL